MITRFDEAELLKRIRQNDRDAFTMLYRYYLQGVYRYVFLITKSKEKSEDIVQCVFIKIWERRQELDSVRSFKAYIFRSAKNLLIDQLKKEKTEVRILKIIQPVTEEGYERADQQINCMELQQISNEAYALLPNKRKQIVQLRTLDELSLDEIAAKLNISKGVVKKQLYTGLHFIKKYLNDHGNIATFLIFVTVLFS